MNTDAYREAERRLVEDAGLEAEELRVDLPRLQGEARVLACGSGEPVVFLSGGPDCAATWAYVGAELEGVRAYFVDRPGTGLSRLAERLPTVDSLSSYVADLTADVLDGLGLERAMLVGCSFGGFSALTSAAALPDRVTGVYLAGCPAFVPGWKQPRFFSVLRTPVLGRLVLRAPVTRGSARMSLRMLGHGRSLREGAIPEPLVDWVAAWQRHTDTMRNDAAMICSLGTWLGGFERSLDLDAVSLAAVTVPCHVLVGTDDVVGARDVGSELVAALPKASLEVWGGAGHLPWYDDPTRFAASLMGFARGLTHLRLQQAEEGD